MMRLNPEGYYRFIQADKFEVSYAGGEANVAVSLANEADAADVFGIVGKGSDVESGKLNKEGYVSVAEVETLAAGNGTGRVQR